MFRASPGQRGNAGRAQGAGTSPCQRWWGWDFIAQQPPSSHSSTEACSAQLSWFALQINFQKPNPAPKPLFPAPAGLMRSSGLGLGLSPAGSQGLGTVQGLPSVTLHAGGRRMFELEDAAPPRPRADNHCLCQGWLPPAPPLPRRNLQRNLQRNLLPLGQLQVTFCKEGDNS